VKVVTKHTSSLRQVFRTTDAPSVERVMTASFWRPAAGPGAEPIELAERRKRDPLHAQSSRTSPGSAR
jgi:hypothetical protein